MRISRSSWSIFRPSRWSSVRGGCLPSSGPRMRPHWSWTCPPMTCSSRPNRSSPCWARRNWRSPPRLGSPTRNEDWWWPTNSMRRALFEVLGVIRVYSKPPGRKADTSTPFILRRGATVLDAAEAIHKDFVARLKYARLWGQDEYQGQMVGRDHVLEDGDVLELHA